MMFIDGVRLSTWIVFPLFLYVGLRRDDPKVFLAAAAWFTGFEAAYQITSIATGHPQPSAVVVTVARFDANVHLPWWPTLVGLGVVLTLAAWKLGFRPDPRIFAFVAAAWIVWIALGFDANEHSMVGFSPVNEAVNEAAKTAWALAYLWPIWPHRRVALFAERQGSGSPTLRREG